MMIVFKLISDSKGQRSYQVVCDDITATITVNKESEQAKYSGDRIPSFPPGWLKDLATKFTKSNNTEKSITIAFG